MTYEVVIRNRGSKSADNVQVAAYFSDGIEPMQVLGQRHQIETGKVTLEPIVRLGPGEQIVARIVARASKPGNHVFRAEVQCPSLETEALRAEDDAILRRGADGQARRPSGRTRPFRGRRPRRLGDRAGRGRSRGEGHAVAPQAGGPQSDAFVPRAATRAGNAAVATTSLDGAHVVGTLRAPSHRRHVERAYCLLRSGPLVAGPSGGPYIRRLSLPRKTRNARPLSMSQELKLIALKQAQPPFYVGVDLGGTNIKVGVVDDLGRVLDHFSIPTEVERGPEDAARRMGEAVLRAIERNRPQAARRRAASASARPARWTSPPAC